MSCGCWQGAESKNGFEFGIADELGGAGFRYKLKEGAIHELPLPLSLNVK
jgi:hypothetical protein